MIAAIANRLEDYRGRAIGGARAATAALDALGVRAVVTGSLARGRFNIHSGVGILVMSCPHRMKYRIESIEDILEGMPFDVIYLDELAPWKAARFMEGAIDASDLD